MRFHSIPGSSLILLEHQRGFRLFCSSFILMSEVEAATWKNAKKYAHEISRIWPKKNFISKREINKEVYLTICLTQSCNLFCRYCYLHGEYLDWPLNNRKSKLSFSLDRIFEEIKKIFSTRPHRLVINYFGGEPLLQKESLYAITEFAESLSAEFNVTIKFGVMTNATLLDQSFLTWAKSKCMDIMISLDSPPLLHDKYRSQGAKGSSFNDILNKIQGFEEEIIAVTAITKKTPSFCEAIEILLDLGFKEVSFNLVHTRDPELSFEKPDIKRIQEEWQREQTWLSNHSTRIGNLKQIHDLISRREAKQSPCASGYSGFAIDSSGKSYFCHSCSGNKDFELDQEKKLISHKWRTIYQQGLQNSLCASCWAYPLCGGECWLIQWNYDNKEKMVRCEFIRGFIRIALSTYNIKAKH